MPVELAHVVGGFIAGAPLLLGAAGVYWKQQGLRKEFDDFKREYNEEMKRGRSAMFNQKRELSEQFTAQLTQVREQLDVNGLRADIRQDVREDRELLLAQIERNREFTMERVKHLEERMANILLVNSDSLQRLAGIESKFAMLLQTLNQKPG